MAAEVLHTGNSHKVQPWKETTMLTLFHAPYSRSSRVLALLCQMDVLDQIDLRYVDIIRFDGSGGRDAANPHPEGKVPLLIDNGVSIRESPAIILHLTDLFPQGNMGVPAGDPLRGAYVSWLVWYGSVVEPVMLLAHLGITHPALQATFRDMAALAARLSDALARGPWLMGDRYTAADLLLASPFLWFSEAMPDDPIIKDWVTRCANQPGLRAAAQMDGAAMAKAA
jgi:glutathione S-transferase